ncbi:MULTISPECIES: STAS domain-containing protein [Xanthomonas]|uniref:STAS domain-containing protein n=1 Tax=Xanthomonas rydalmerensis TaxID=3046274 RepID=A0ABZ0JK93_9XANT|nr:MULTISPECIES: STAS domain-containing protein [unclassified Xanthomonas]MBB5877465.1 anti-anti-sigma factor [Xanthomonas sp. 3498]MBB5940741.1 anti-anti-sigma factor [Xanthomonas sp. 3307]WOS39404.1 STAS domain-containing protein [Xanthomonas sp. DM-2023]WOS43588.1 STAS domain-containing protein [Xanthomonas sp. DM-2023]WOS47769.1 STAS domain-containing protein [Xanthomonas sp. DM-2023]
MRSTPPDEQDSPLQLSVDGDMTIRRAAELKPLLLPALEHPGGLRLQLQAVADIDATGVQLLLATQAALRALGRPLQLEGCSKAVGDALDLLGLGDAFERVGDDTLH